LDFKVIEFSKDAKKIIVSHSRIHEAVVEAEVKKDVTKKKTQGKAARKAVKDLNSSAEKTTLGDLGVLSSLKDEMEEAEKKDSKK